MWRFAQKKVRFVQQLEAADCGAACLAMAMDYVGHAVSLPEARESTRAGWTEGISAAAIIRGADQFGVLARAVALDIDGFRDLPAGSIMHWAFDHYVVFVRLGRSGIHVVDPASGPRFISLNKVRQLFTGVAITFRRSESFVPRKRDLPKRSGLKFGLRAHVATFARVVTISVVLRGLGLFLPLLTALVVDEVVPHHDLSLLSALASGAALLIALQFLAQVLRSQFLLQLRTDIDMKLSVGFVSHLASLPFEFFQRHSGGDLVSRANSNSAIREILATSTLSGIIDGTLVVFYAALIVAASSTMGIIVVLSGGAYVVVYILSRRRVRELSSEQLEAQAKSQSYLIELIQGIETIKMCAAEYRAVERWTNLYVTELNIALRSGRLGGLVESCRSLIANTSPILLMLYGARQVTAGSMSLGEMLAINTLAIGFWLPLSNLLESALRMQLLVSYAERTRDVTESKPEEANCSAVDVRVNGEISCNGLGFGYGEKNALVIRELTATFQPGRSTAIVGHSGCGKTTLAKLLSGLMSPSVGSVSWNGVDLRNLNLRSLRRQLGVVTQHPTLFSGSIRSAIAMLDPQTSLLDVIEAAKIACIDDEIRRLPMGYNTILADGGGSLSGGQRQRIALARALVHKPQVLILDEATSALDAETESNVMTNIAQLSSTRIIIAHRLSSIRHADQILVMDDGLLVEQGRHEELVTLNGVYHRLVSRQLGPQTAT